MPSSLTKNQEYRNFAKVFILLSYNIIALFTSVAQAKSTSYAYSQSPDSIHAAWDDNDGEIISLAELEVDGSISSLASERASRIVTIVTKAEIKNLPAQSISDILKLTSGIDVRQRAPFGVQADISIDGGTYDQVSILLNGVNITSAQTGHYSADWPVSIDDIERIEIVEGAASRYMGGSSLMGAINIVTSKYDESAATFKAEGGSYATFGAEGRLAYCGKNTRHSLSGGYKRSDGGTVNSEFRKAQAFYQGITDNSVFEASWQAGWSDLDHGANTFYSGAYPNQHDAIRRYIIGASGATKGRIRIEPMIYWQRLYDHYQLVHNTSAGENFHRNEAFGGRLNASTTWALGRTLIGAELRRESVISTTLGHPLSQPVAANDSVDYKYSDSRTNLSFSFEHILALGRLNASAGFTSSMNTGYDHKFRFYPGIDASFALSRKLKLYASWGKSYRMPTFTDLYYKSPTHEGNRNLKPELMDSWQCGLQLNTSWVNLRCNLFAHYGRNMIDWVMYTPDDEFHATGFNLDNYGASVRTIIRFAQLLGSHQPFLNLDVSYTYMYQHRRDVIEIYESRAALEYLRHKFTANLTHRLWHGVTATWSLRWQDRMGDFLLYTDGKSQGRLEPYRPYATLDLKIDYSINRWLLSLSAANITNHRYYDCANIPQPGIWIMGAVKYTLRY